MSLVETELGYQHLGRNMNRRTVRVGARLAWVGPHAAMCEGDVPLDPGDVVEVIEVDESDDCLIVLVLRGRQAGRIGEVHLDLQARVLRGWRGLTRTGSVARASQRAPGSRRGASA
jgi:hypothetical protein